MAKYNRSLLEKGLIIRLFKIFSPYFPDNSNCYYVLALTDHEPVDYRREAASLKNLLDSLSRWKLKWDAEEYKKSPALSPWKK